LAGWHQLELVLVELEPPEYLEVPQLVELEALVELEEYLSPRR
jgi:hypothetical protein